MTSLRAVKNKINSVKSIKKIFSVMQLIAASKMKKAQDAFNSSNKTIDHIENLLNEAIDKDIGIINTIFENKKLTVKKSLYLVFCSDRGLCGNYNSLIMRKITEILKNQNDIEIAIIGNKLKSQLEKQFFSFINQELSNKFDEHIKDENKISILFDKIFSMKSRGEIKDCKVIYVFSKNAMSKEVRELDLFLIDKKKRIHPKEFYIESNDNELNDDNSGIIYEDNKLNVVQFLIKFYFQLKFFSIFRAAYFSELASRMIAMDNASRNAQEIQNKLTLFFNKKRQANITNDLIDIINGAENL